MARTIIDMPTTLSPTEVEAKLTAFLQNNKFKKVNFRGESLYRIGALPMRPGYLKIQCENSTVHIEAFYVDRRGDLDIHSYLDPYDLRKKLIPLLLELGFNLADSELQEKLYKKTADRPGGDFPQPDYAAASGNEERRMDRKRKVKKFCLAVLFIFLTLLAGCTTLLILFPTPSEAGMLSSLSDKAKPVKSPTVDNNTDGASLSLAFSDGSLIMPPQRLKAKASDDDGISTAALIGPWESNRDSINTEYGFSDDGYFYKNVMITHTHMRSTYHSGYWEYGSYYDTYHYGWWETSFNYSYTYMDTLIGEYKVKGGVIEFDHVVAINRTTFEDDWYYEKTRSVSMEQLQKNATSARLQEDLAVEFEFINPTRLRFRDDSEDIDLFWDINDDPHNVPVPNHEIYAVEWPHKALSPDTPVFATKGRVREASLLSSADDKKIKDEFKTVTVVIDKAEALSEIDAYGSSLRKNGWWVEDYELGDEDTSLSYEARKGMFKLEISNGRGSGTSEDTIVIESVRYPEGQWPDAWSKAGLEPPDNSIVVGDIEADKTDEKNIYETTIFDKVDDGGVNAYKNKLLDAGFKQPQYSYNDWEFMKYIRIDGELYLVMVRLDRRMDSLSSFIYDLAYVPDGIWPESWINGGLPVPDGFSAIAGAIDTEEWAANLADYASDYESIKFLGLDAGETDDYFDKLRASGFTQVQDEYSDEIKLYANLRIDGKLLRVEVSPVENEDIAEISFYFEYFEDGRWPQIWQDGGLPAPDGYDTISGAIDPEKWAQNNADYASDYLRIKFLGLDEAEAENYFAALRSAGFAQVRDDWDDTVRLYNYLRIDGGLYRVEVRREENDELTEFSYSFDYFEDGFWPQIWQDGGLPAPDGAEAIVGAIDVDGWAQDIAEYGSGYEYIKFLGLDENETEGYIEKLESAGFKRIENEWDDTVRLCNYPRIDGRLCRVEIELEENDELTEFCYSFDYYEDGEWPSAWESAGIPSPSFTAMPGKIDMQEFNSNLSDYGSYYASIKLFGANLSDYAAILISNGYAEPEYAYTDTWELEKSILLDGKRYTVTIYDEGNDEIPEISISIDLEYE